MRTRILMLLTASMSLFGVTQTMAMQNGFYVGVDAGAADLMDKESHSVSPESHQLGSIGAVGGIFAGYDYGMTDNTRIALEGFADATGLQTKIQHAGNTYQMNQQYNLGLRVLPGYLFTSDTIGHLVFGYANGRFKIKDNGVYGLINTTYNQNGFQTGLGLATALKSNVFVRLDALYSIYSSSTNQGNGLTAGTSQYYTNRFSQLAGELALYYMFS